MKKKNLDTFKAAASNLQKAEELLMKKLDGCNSKDELEEVLLHLL